jgi:hypothetical protein
MEAQQLLALANGKDKFAFALACLLYFDVARNILNQFMNRRFVMHPRCQARIVQEIHDWPTAERVPANFDPAARAGPALRVAA